MSGEVEALAREIGATFQPADDTAAFRARWASALAVQVGGLGRTHACPYKDRLAGWIARIDNATDAEMPSVLENIRDEIARVDSDDGWAVDPAGGALESVTLVLLPGTRWMAQAGLDVWAHVTGAGAAWNAVVQFSRNAWLADLYERCAGRKTEGRA